MPSMLSLPSPFGPLRLVGDDVGLTRLLFPEQAPPKGAFPGESLLLRQAALELEEYFSGKRNHFTVKFHLSGTPFQQAVWSALLEIPYGHTASYRDIAVKIGKPAAARAVGQANGANPLPILIPCHRVVAADSSLGGYAFGLEIKRNLLELEGISVHTETGGRKTVLPSKNPVTRSGG